MENGNISEVVLGFKRMVDNIPAYYDNFEDGLDKLYDAFQTIMDEFIPLKYFARHDYGNWSANWGEIKIFDTAEQRDEWILNACKNDEFHENDYYILLSEQFVAFANGNIGVIGCYSVDEDGVLTFCLR